MEDLLGFDDQAEPVAAHSERQASRRPRSFYDWAPSEGGPLSLPIGAGVKPVSIAAAEESRFALDVEAPARSNGHEALYVREGELMSKLHDLLHSPLGGGVVRLIEELHGLLPRLRSSI
jgi:hypothetical protein